MTCCPIWSNEGNKNQFSLNQIVSDFLHKIVGSHSFCPPNYFSRCTAFLEKRSNLFFSDRKSTMTPGKLKINDLLHFKKPLYLAWVVWTQIAASFKLQVKKEKYLRQNSSGWFLSQEILAVIAVSQVRHTSPPCSHPDHNQVFEELLPSSSEEHTGL